MKSFFFPWRCGSCRVLSGVTHYLCPGWKMRQWPCASSQNLFPDSWIVNKVRLLHFSLAWRAFLSRLVFPPQSCLLLRWWVLRKETLGRSAPTLTDGWIRQGLEVNTSIWGANLSPATAYGRLIPAGRSKSGRDGRHIPGSWWKRPRSF